MNPLAPYMLFIKIGAAIALLAALVGYHHHVLEQGVAQESARRDKIDAVNTIKAQAELATLNEKLKAEQAQLTAAIADLATKQTELDNEKAISSTRESDLRAGRERERVLVSAHKQRDIAQAGPAGGTPAAAMDQGTGTLEDLDPAVAAGLERIRINENAAIDRLGACITAYDAVRAAAQQ